MKERFYIKGISCASCASKIEDSIKKIPNIRNVSLSFATGLLEISGDFGDDIFSIIKKKVESIEPKAKLSKKEDKEESNFSVKKELSILSILIVIFLICIAIIHLSENIIMQNIAIFTLIIIYAISGREIICSALESITKKDFFNENSLMSMATIAAFLIGSYEEAVAVMLFFKTGEFFQELALNNSKRSIKSLLQIAPNIAHLKKDSKIIDIAPQDLKIDDIVLVKPGEKIPIDGVVVEGESLIDTKSLTGESIPKNSKLHSKVLGGSLNLNGILEVKTTKLYEDSSIAKVIDLVQNATANKANTESFITKFAKIYTPIVFFIALCIAIIPPALGFGEFSEWIYRALVMLMVSCPCALVISVPLAYFGGIGSASKNYILIKGASFLEALSDVESIAFDKTGTLTKGVFKVVEIVPQNGFSKEEVLQYAHCAEVFSNHPIASAIKEEYKKLNFEHKCNAKNFESLSGLGIKTTCNFENIIVGNDKILHKYDIEHNTCSVNGTVAHIAVNGKYAGYIIIADELKDDTLEAIEGLRNLGVKNLVMLTGDNEFAASNIAKELGLDSVKYNLLPEEKVEHFREIKNNSSGKSVFVGDGINDAPSIALADVGVSMGSLGSDVSKESADVLIINDSIKSLCKTIKIAKKTKNIIWQNIIFALGVKVLFIILGLFGIASMWEAVFGDIGVALIALFNSMRILKA
ncbi:MAG: cadmium-translocating P-type ATPase [Helicobacteraceae bacterium]|nr:cadmium-translocating P-type ATPase [Helicobacteraceae bacterium]